MVLHVPFYPVSYAYHSEKIQGRKPGEILKIKRNTIFPTMQDRMRVAFVCDIVSPRFSEMLKKNSNKSQLF